MGKIFISYRRADSEYVVGRIYEELCEKYGEKNIFKDIESIPLGVDFRDEISRVVNTCDLLLAIIGENWSNIKDDSGNKRLFSENDFVRIEIEEALKRNVPVIPIIINNSTLPEEKDLPDSLKALAYRNAISIRPDPDFRNDLHRLTKDINKIYKVDVSKKTNYFIVAAAIAIFSITLLLFNLYNNIQDKKSTAEQVRIQQETDRANQRSILEQTVKEAQGRADKAEQRESATRLEVAQIKQRIAEARSSEETAKRVALEAKQNMRDAQKAAKKAEKREAKAVKALNKAQQKERAAQKDVLEAENSGRQEAISIARKKQVEATENVKKAKQELVKKTSDKSIKLNEAVIAKQQSSKKTTLAIIAKQSSDKEKVQLLNLNRNKESVISTGGISRNHTPEFYKAEKFGLMARLVDGKTMGNIRSSSDKNSDNIVTTVGENEIFYTHMQSGEDWWFVKTKDNIKGYISAKILNVYDDRKFYLKATVKTKHKGSKVRVRKNRNTSSAIVKNITSGTIFYTFPHANHKNWINVRFPKDDKEGYIRKDFVKLISK